MQSSHAYVFSATLVAPMPPRPTPNVESPRTLFVPYKSHPSVQMNDLMKIHMPKPRSNEMFDPKCPNKQLWLVF